MTYITYIGLVLLIVLVALFVLTLSQEGSKKIVEQEKVEEKKTNLYQILQDLYKNLLDHIGHKHR